MVNGWNVIAIIFIILFILESLFLFWAFNLGTQFIENENECSINVCADYETYYYDEWDNICYCFNDGEIEHQEYLGR